MNPPSGGAKTANSESDREKRGLVADQIPIGRHPTSYSLLPLSPTGGLFVRTGFFLYAAGFAAMLFIAKFISLDKNVVVIRLFFLLMVCLIFQS